MSSALSTAVSQRMLHRIDAPAFVVQQRIIQHAANGEFAVLFDRIVLHVLIATVAVRQIFPFRVPVADLATKSQSHRGRLHVQWLVVFNHLDSFAIVNRRGGHVDDFQKQVHIQRGKEFMSLSRILAFRIQRQRERLQSAGRFTSLSQRIVDRQEYCPAIDPAAEEHTDRLACWNLIEPAINLLLHRTDIRVADLIQIGTELVAFRCEEPHAARTRVRTSNQSQLLNMMRRHHARVRRMKLLGEPFLLQPCGDFINAFRHDQTRPRNLLRQKVPHRPADRPSHPNDMPILMHQRKLPINRTDLRRIPRPQPSSRFFDRHIEDRIVLRIEQVNESFNVLVIVHFDTAF